MSYIQQIACEFWNTLGEMSPYLLLGFAVAGALSVLVSPTLVERHLGGPGLKSAFKAAVFGVPLPLCSCGVIPVATSLRRHGASRGAATAFLLSTPQTGVDSIFVTLSLLGPVFAIFRPVAALLTGMIGGTAIDAFAGRGDNVTEQQETTCTDECCKPDATDGHRVARALHYGFVTLPADIAKPILAGMLIAAMIAAFVPGDFFAQTLGGGIVAMLVMMVLGIPVYVCATASVPIAAVLMAKGVSPGAALVFLMTGPATNAAAFATIWKVMGRRTAGIYLATVVVAALACGLLLDYLFSVTGITPAAAMPWMIPGYARSTAGIALLAVLGYAILGQLRSHEHCSCEKNETSAD